MNRNEFVTAAKTFILEGWTSYVLIAVGLLVFLAIIGLTTQYFVRDKADRLTQTHVLAGESAIGCPIVADAQKVSFINEQRKEISDFGNSHRKSAITFFTYFYITYLIFTIFGLIAAISLAVITKTGINSASPHLITVFLVCTAIVVLYQGAFGVFQHKSNIDSNAKLSTSYAVLLDQIDTYCSTGKINVKDPSEAFAAALPKPVTKPSNSKTNSEVKSAPATDSVTVATTKIEQFYVEPNGDQFINFVAWQLEHLRSFSITLDDTKVAAIDSKRFLFQ